MAVCARREMTDQFFLLHALHEDDEQMLSLCAAVGESLLYGHQQLVSQSLINYPAEEERRKKNFLKKSVRKDVKLMVVGQEKN